VACQPIDQIPLSSATKTDAITVRLILTVPHDMYNLMVQDFIPAGTVIFNSNLNTSQQGLDNQPNGLPAINSSNPFQYGWGWWIFNNPQIYYDHILWTAAYLPAGTYELTYTLIPTHTGEFRVIPARAWEAFFPEVQGTTAGSIFKITE
jgi:alpha-2-macroglobulin